jgi:cobalt-zinc-cadmium efflux system outer membrane protein
MSGLARFAVVLLMALSLAGSPRAQETGPLRLSLDQAIEQALARNPVLAAGRASLEAAEARQVAAETYPHDPTLRVEGADRDGEGDSSTDWAVKLTQPIEIGGQRRRRVSHASAAFDAAGAELRREERLLAARVSAVFVEGLRARELLDVERANAELVQSLADVAQRRFEAGDVPQIEVNLAQVQVGRAQRSLRLARAAYEIACAALAEVVGHDPVRAPEPAGELKLPPRTVAPALDLVEGAVRQRADLEALRGTIEAARARIELARREVVPHLALEAFYAEEENDRLLGGGIGIRIPLFNRNRGAIAEARAAERRAVADRESAELRVRREVVEARARYEAALDASATLQDSVLGTLEENLSLLQRSFEAGKTGWTEVLVFRREFIDSRRAYIESLADAWLAGVELDLAAGRAPVTATVP